MKATAKSFWQKAIQKRIDSGIQIVATTCTINENIIVFWYLKKLWNSFNCKLQYHAPFLFLFLPDTIWSISRILMSSGVHVLDFVTMTIIIRMTWYGVQQIRKHTITATETYIENDKDNQWWYLIELNLWRISLNWMIEKFLTYFASV